ncbi:MAG: class I fructose-bisphosphate aldolase [Candidatus Paceibacterota bacterium]
MTLKETAQKLVEAPKGILAADSRNSSMDKKLASVGVPGTPEDRRHYRNILFTTPEIENYITGVILFDETMRQQTDDGILFPDYLNQKGILPGIKVDEGKEPFGDSPKEEVTKGIASLQTRLPEYKGMGAHFTKWRAVIRIGEGLPGKVAVEENAKRLAVFARISQEFSLVPIVEPEVLYDGIHTLERSEEVLERTLIMVFDALQKEKVDLGGMLLKTSMALPGKDSGIAFDPALIAKATVEALKNSVPPEVPGVVFLSGGQTGKEAATNLNAIAQLGGQPWPLTFSFARALHNPVLEIWRGDDTKIEEAQEAFQKRMRLATLAREGKYNASME